LDEEEQLKLPLEPPAHQSEIKNKKKKIQRKGFDNDENEDIPHLHADNSQVEADVKKQKHFDAREKEDEGDNPQQQHIDDHF